MSDVEGEEGQEKSFRVKDNRRFDQEGNERSDSGEPTSSVAAKNVVSTQQGSRVGESKAARIVAPNAAAASDPNFSMDSGPVESDEPGFDFRSFVISLATQALMQMGVMQPPPGVEAGIDREGARQTIAILTMLDRKTRGNLDAEEAKLLEEVLHSLRLNFLRLA